MVTPKNRRQDTKKRNWIDAVAKFHSKYCNLNYVKSLLFDPVQLPVVSVAILIIEFILNIFVVQRIKYTEIDWIAYMQECEGFLNGTTNYALLRGDTGPLVYPAGFVYIYTFFYYLTDRGQNIRVAQYVFVGIYLLQMCLMLNIYTKSRKVPPYVMIISAFTSYRIHSIYVLRLFNDPIAILLLYIALNFYLTERWTLASVFLSLGVSVKMNVLLFAPAILLFYIVNLGYAKTIKQLAICAGIQLLLGAPFLLTYPIEYMKGSFDLGRVFDHKWTVNYRFLTREQFENKYFHIGLLCVHVLLLLAFALPSYQYFKSYCRLRELQRQLQVQIDAKNRSETIERAKTKKSKAPKTDETLTSEQQSFLSSFETVLKNASPTATAKIEQETAADVNETTKYEIFFDKSIQLAILPIFLANFIGVVCARSLHYQFYVWYFHSLPYLIWFTDYNLSLKFLILGIIEYAWNTYPSTDTSSTLLHVSHVILLAGIAFKIARVQNLYGKLKIN